MPEYCFDITYVRLSVYRSHSETASFPTKGRAYAHFQKLLEQFGVDGQSYYLCRWREMRDATGK